MQDIWIKGVYTSCNLKGQCESRVLGFDSLASNNASMYLISICKVYRIGNHDLMVTLLRD